MSAGKGSKPRPVKGSAYRDNFDSIFRKPPLKYTGCKIVPLIPELENTHKETEECRRYGCCIHNPTHHHMEKWTQLWRGDRHMMERLCPAHGVGHPDPDHMSWYARHHSAEDTAAEGVHGCCGCCGGILGDLERPVFDGPPEKSRPFMRTNTEGDE